MLSANSSAIFYLISGVLFILALRGLSSPETSRQGNFFGILGMIIEIKIKAFNGCWPLKVIGEPDITPWSFKKAIIEPEKVIAPTAAPIDISIKLPSLMLPGDPKLKASGFKKAAIATNTAARPTKLWKPATNSGMAVIGIL